MYGTFFFFKYVHKSYKTPKNQYGFMCSSNAIIFFLAPASSLWN